MEYLQIGSSTFIKKILSNNLKILNFISLRDFIARDFVNLKVDGVILVPPKNNIVCIDKKKFSFNVSELILISSIAVNVKSFVSPKFQQYKQYKISVESNVSNEGKIRFLRLAMFVSLSNYRSIIIFLLAFLLSFFAPKSRVYMYTTANCLKNINFYDDDTDCFSEIKGKGLFYFKHRSFRRLVSKFFVKL